MWFVGLKRDLHTLLFHFFFGSFLGSYEMMMAVGVVVGVAVVGVVGMSTA